jgi:hypothetical protein
MGVTPLAPQASASASSATFASGPSRVVAGRGVRIFRAGPARGPRCLGGRDAESEGVYLTQGELCKPEACHRVP